MSNRWTALVSVAVFACVVGCASDGDYEIYTPYSSLEAPPVLPRSESSPLPPPASLPRHGSHGQNAE